MSSFSCIGQTFAIGNITTPKDDGTGLYKAQLKITNQSFSDKTLKVVAFLNEKNSKHISYFCTGTLCYGDGTMEVEYPMSATTTDDFITYLDPAGIDAMSRIRYEFSDAANPTDKIEYTFVFNIGATSVNNDGQVNFAALSSPMPNPARETTTIKYMIKEGSFNTATLELYSADSKHIKTISLSQSSSSIQFKTDDFPAGIYFYILVIDGKKITTNRLAVIR